MKEPKTRKENKLKKQLYNLALPVFLEVLGLLCKVIKRNCVAFF